MAIINISRQPHSSQTEIAFEISEKLNYQLLDKAIINQKVKDFHCNFSDELFDLANEKEPGFFQHFFKSPEVYNCLVQSIIFEAASYDNVVVNGRGGQYILDRPYALNIRIIAPFEVRCSYLEKEDGINRSVVRKQLEEKDLQRQNFIQYVFNRDISEAGPYDLIFRHYKLSVDDIVSTILDHVEKLEKAYPLTDQDKDHLKRMSLAKRVEATLKKQMPDHEQLNIECEALGAIRLLGFVPNEAQGTEMCELAYRCNGVDSVDNQLVWKTPGI